MTTLYGIANCDTIKKAKKWLTTHEIDYDFHDFKKAGLDEATLKNWIKKVDWEVLLNKRGTTWRKLDESIKNDVTEKSAISIMLNHTSVIKRPVLVHNKNVYVGFKEDTYQTIFKS